MALGGESAPAGERILGGGRPVPSIDGAIRPIDAQWGLILAVLVLWAVVAVLRLTGVLTVGASVTGAAICVVATLFVVALWDLLALIFPRIRPPAPFAGKLPTFLEGVWRVVGPGWNRHIWPRRHLWPVVCMGAGLWFGHAVWN